MVICQEVVHSLRFTTARRGGMILKIDLEKAYDMIDWDFVEDMLRDAYMRQHIINAIMGILRRSSSRLLWNKEITNKIKHTGGLKQGDPLFPYLFVLCLECSALAIGFRRRWQMEFGSL